MANVYVRSGAGGAGTGADWANAFTTLVAAFAAKAAGDDFWVSDDHAESQGSNMVLTSPGTAASPCRIICVNHLGSVPPVAADLRTTATIKTTTTFNIKIGVSYDYWYGIQFTGGSGANTSSMNVATNNGAQWHRLEACVIESGSTSSGSMNFGASLPNAQAAVELFNTQLKWNVVSNNGFNALGCVFRWENTPNAILGQAPTTLFSNATQNGTEIVFRGLDLSAMTSGSIYNAGAITPLNAVFEDCVLNDALTFIAGSFGGQNNRVLRFLNCSSTDTKYRYHLSAYQGDISHEITVVKSGGANDGTTSFARKMVTSANSKWYSPLESDWMSFWNDSIGSVTVSIPVITDNVTLTTADIALEVEYQGTASLPLGTFVSSGIANVLTTGSNYALDTVSSWTTTGITTPVKQLLTVTFNAVGKGLVRARIKLAKASTTVWFDPEVLISSGRQYTIGQSGVINEKPAAQPPLLVVRGGS